MKIGLENYADFMMNLAIRMERQRQKENEKKYKEGLKKASRLFRESAPHKAFFFQAYLNLNRHIDVTIFKKRGSSQTHWAHRFSAFNPSERNVSPPKKHRPGLGRADSLEKERERDEETLKEMAN